MALATLEDVKRVIRAGVADDDSKRIKIGDAITDDITTADAQKYLDTHEGYVIGRLGATPDSSPLIRDIVAYLTAYHIYITVLVMSRGGEIPDFAEEWNRWAEEKLDQLVSGVITPPEKSEHPLFVSSSSRHRRVFQDKIKLSDTDFIELQHSYLVPYSEKITKADGSVTYTRNTDYEISWYSGELRRLDTGAIIESQEVVISYYFTQKTEMIDRVESVDYR